MSEFEKALLLMLNAIRLQIFALSWALPNTTIPKESEVAFKDCLEQSARLADMAMEVADLVEPVEAP